MKVRLAFGVFIALGLAVAVALVVFVGPWASDQPDGLNKVAADQGFADREQPQALAGSPTADYRVRGVSDRGLSTGLAGVIGVTVTFGLSGGLFLVVRRVSSRSRSEA